MFSKIIIILAVNILLYAKTLKLGYVSDDLPTFKNPPVMKTKWDKIFRWVMGQYKSCPKYDHLLTTIIHAVISAFIYLAFGANHISYIAAMLFSCNPANNQVSIWISGRGYALTALILLSAMSIPYVAPAILLMIGYFNVGYFAPLALIGSTKYQLLWMLPVIWWTWRRKFKKDFLLKIGVETVVEDSKIHLKKLILAIKTMGFYLTLCLIPFRLTFYHSFLQSCAGNDIMKKRAYSFDKFFWFGMTAIGVFVWLWITQGWSITTYGMFWFFVSIAPFSNFRRFQQEIADRYMYLPNIGLMIALASLIHTYPILIVLFMTMYISRLIPIMHMYTDDYWLVEMCVNEDPGAWYAWHIRGFKRWDNKSYREALTMWVMAKLLDPKEFKILFNISIVLRLLKQYAEADAYLKMAEDNIIEGQEEAAKALIAEYRSGRARMLL